MAQFSVKTMRLTGSLLGENQYSLKRIIYMPCQLLPGIPFHDRDQIEEATAHRYVGDVGAPDLIGPFHSQSTQQIEVGFAPFRQSAPSQTCRHVLPGNGYRDSGKSASGASAASAAGWGCSSGHISRFVSATSSAVRRKTGFRGIVPHGLQARLLPANGSWITPP